jgi:multiple sugar transport system substrate-binding protein
MAKSKSRGVRTVSSTGTARRRFLKSAGAGAGIAALSTTGVAPFIFVRKAQAADKELKIIQWSHFVPSYDKWFDQFVKDWGPPTV